MRRAVFAIVLVLFSLSSLSAAGETYFSNIVNASFLSDFAFSTFPVSFWGEFGIRDLDLLEDRESSIVVRIEAGLAQRYLRQYPESGSVISDHVIGSSEAYSVVFSDGSVGFEQGLIDSFNPGKADFLTVAVYLGMRWEQAFASLGDIQKGNYSGIFSSEDYFPSYLNGIFPGVPELSGNHYSLTNYMMLTLSLQDRDPDGITPEGYAFSASFTYAPWWLANDLDFFASKIDFFRMMYSASYTYTILQQNQRDNNDMSLFSLYFDFAFRCQFLFGSSVPQHANQLSFRGRTIPPRLFFADLYASLTLTGPEFLWKGTFPTLLVFFENAIAAGGFVNSQTAVEHDQAFYGTLGMRAGLSIIDMLSVYVGFYYDYLPPEGYSGKVGLDLGFTFSAMF